MRNYNFEFAVSAKISAKVIEQMIKRVVEEQTEKKVVDVKLEMRTITTGSSINEHNETVFDGATVYFENEKSVPKQGSKVFTPDSYDPNVR